LPGLFDQAEPRDGFPPDTPRMLLSCLLFPCLLLPGEGLRLPHPASTAHDPRFCLQDPAPPPTEPKWTGSVTAGGTLTTGNSETRAGNATADAELRREKDRFTLGFLWNYADEKNTTPDWNLTDRRTSAKAKYDYFLSEKSYLLAQTSAEADEAADLDLRTTFGVGAGRQFREEEDFKLSGEIGLSYFIEEFETIDDEYLAARAAENVDWKIDERWNVLNTTEVFPSLEDSEDVYVKVDTRAKLTVT